MLPGADNSAPDVAKGTWDNLKMNILVLTKLTTPIYSILMVSTDSASQHRLKKKQLFYSILMVKIKEKSRWRKFSFGGGRWAGGGGGRSINELPSQIVNEVVIWGLLIQNSLPGKKTIRIVAVAILVYIYKDKPLLFLIL